MAGFIWLLLGLLLAPSSKLYHQLLIGLLWIPGFLLTFTIKDWLKGLDGSLLVLLGLVVVESMLSVLWGGNPHQLKEVCYVLLTAHSIFMLSQWSSVRLWRCVALSAFLGGFLAWLSLFYCYFVLNNGWDVRCIGTGQLEHTILASHVLGVLCVCLINLRPYLPKIMQRGYWLIPCLGYVVFMVMSRTKGTLLALCLCLCLFYLWKPHRRSLILAAGTAAAALLALALFPHELLRDGFSLRPELLKLALEQLKNHPWLGMGMDAKYLLTIPDTGVSYKHAHNFYMHVALQFGVLGLGLWLSLVAGAAYRSWQYRKTPQGRALCAVLCFSCVALLTDGMGPWLKPREEWFTVWLPIFLSMTLVATSRNSSGSEPAVKTL